MTVTGGDAIHPDLREAMHRYNVGPDWTRAEVLKLVQRLTRVPEPGARTLDAEGVCTRCGCPDVHCMCADVVAWNIVTLGDGRTAMLRPVSAWCRTRNADGTLRCNHPDNYGCEWPNHDTVTLYEVVT